MKADELSKLMQEQFEICQYVMSQKAGEYTEEDPDKLAAIKAAAALQGISTQAAAMGMLSKHIVSIADMCVSGRHYAPERWNEKITDAMNYLFFIRAILTEQERQETGVSLMSPSEAMLP